MDLLAGLNPAQRRAVQAVSGPLLIIAGPGSGKTRVITHRIAYLVGVLGVSPYNVMAVTFTNKAAREMLTRLRHLLPGSVERLTVGTFHAICARVLRRDGQSIGLDSGFAIYDDDDQIGLIRRALKDLNLDERQYSPRAVLATISAAKSELRDPRQFAEYASSYWEEVVLRVYRRYQELLAECKALDFDDLLLTTARLFRERPDILEKYQDRYHHVLVDEFQDTNLCQYALVRQIGGKQRNICVVGDPDQSIYSWRSADIRNILNFEQDFPGCETIRLEQNYRSTKVILDAATAVVSHNRMRKEKELWTANDQGVPVVVYEAQDEEEEADWVATQVERLIARGEVRPRDCAVMYRTNAQSRVVEKVFLRRRIPHKVVGVRFYQRKEVKDVLAYLRVIHTPDDSISLLRIVNVPPRGLGAKTLAELEGSSRTQHTSIYGALRSLAGDVTSGASQSPFASRAEQKLLDFLKLMEELRAASVACGLVDLMRLVLERTGYRLSLQDGTEEGEGRWENVKELLGVAAEYAQLMPEAGLTAFLEEAALSTDADEYDEEADAVSLITLHAAKGLEFTAVFIVGLEDGICPHSRSFDEPERMEEERRLFYVGMTRARQRLYLAHAQRRALFGGTTVGEPSRFLADIPSRLVEARATGVRFGGIAASPSQRSLRQETVPLPQETARDVPKPAARRFKPGDRVRHAKFGDGIVVSSAVGLGDEEVEVAFPGIGLKKLSTAFAPLTLLP